MVITGWSFYVAFVVAVDFAADLICLFNQPNIFHFSTVTQALQTRE